LKKDFGLVAWFRNGRNGDFAAASSCILKCVCCLMMVNVR
jgi:hypothetical protein